MQGEGSPPSPPSGCMSAGSSYIWKSAVNGKIMQIKLTKGRCKSATHFIHKLSDCVR